jgi:hypothetical protein
LPETKESVERTAQREKGIWERRAKGEIERRGGII